MRLTFPLLTKENELSFDFAIKRYETWFIFKERNKIILLYKKNQFRYYLYLLILIKNELKIETIIKVSKI